MTRDEALASARNVGALVGGYCHSIGEQPRIDDLWCAEVSYGNWVKEFSSGATEEELRQAYRLAAESEFLRLNEKGVK